MLLPKRHQKAFLLAPPIPSVVPQLATSTLRMAQHCALQILPSVTQIPLVATQIPLAVHLLAEQSLALHLARQTQ